MADTYNFEIEEGVPLQLRFEVRDSEGNSGIPAGTTGAVMQIRQTQSSAGTIILNCNTAGTVSTDVITGYIDIVCNESATAGLTFPADGVGYYDLVMINPSPFLRVAQGRVTYNKRVST